MEKLTLQDAANAEESAAAFLMNEEPALAQRTPKTKQANPEQIIPLDAAVEDR